MSDQRRRRAERNMRALWALVERAHPDWTPTEIARFLWKDLKLPKEKTFKRRPKKRSR
jgi:hypothetical protein